jgi:hypothetical protein
VLHALGKEDKDRFKDEVFPAGGMNIAASKTDI